MDVLTDQAIEHIGDLLLHAAPSNIALAKSLLTPHYVEALPRMAHRAALYTLFEPDDVHFRTWVLETLGAPFLKQHPFTWLVKPHPLFLGTQHSVAALLKALPLWKAYDADFVHHPKRAKAYRSFYQQMSGQVSIRWPNTQLHIFLLQKLLQCFPREDQWDARPARWSYQLAHLMHQHLPSPLLTPTLQTEVLERYAYAYQASPSARTLQEWGAFATQIQDWERAAALYQQGVATYPKAAAFHLGMGAVSLQNTNLLAANNWAASAEKRLQQDNAPQQAQFHLLRARIAQQEKQPIDTVLGFYQQALAVSPKDLHILEEWGNFLMNNVGPSAFESIVKFYEKVIDGQPRYAPNYWALGAFCIAHRQPAYALKVYQRATYYSIDPKFRKEIQRLQAKT